MQTIVSDNEYYSVGFSLGKLDGLLNDGLLNGGLLNDGLLNDGGRNGLITYNYHMSGFKNDGWVVGTGIGFYDEKSYTQLFT